MIEGVHRRSLKQVYELGRHRAILKLIHSTVPHKHIAPSLLKGIEELIKDKVK